jgi:hypothetical protein
MWSGWSKMAWRVCVQSRSRGGGGAAGEVGGLAGEDEVVDAGDEADGGEGAVEPAGSQERGEAGVLSGGGGQAVHDGGAARGGEGQAVGPVVQLAGSAAVHIRHARPSLSGRVLVAFWCGLNETGSGKVQRCFDFLGGLEPGRTGYRGDAAMPLPETT